MRILVIVVGRHRGKEGKVECSICGAECESVVHVLSEYYTVPSAKTVQLSKFSFLGHILAILHGTDTRYISK